MNIQDVIEALAAKGLGSRDFLTGETTVETAQLDEDINGDGGLTVSWRSTDGGVIPAGDMLLGYVMMTPYVPSTNDDGTYSWSPKWSEPSAILSKTPYGKMLTMVRRDSWLDGCRTVVAIANDSQSFPPGTADGDLAIENAVNDDVLYCWHADTEQWVDDGPQAKDGDKWLLTTNNHTIAYEVTNGEGNWVDKGVTDFEETNVYTHSFAGNVRTIVEDMNTFLVNTLGSDWSVELEDDKKHSLATTYIVCTFDGCDVKAAIEEIANAAAAAYEGDGAVNLYYVGKTIHLGLSRAFAADEYYNRFVVLGGTRNMAKRVPAGNAYAAITQRLHIPAGTYTVGSDTVTVEQGSVIDMRSNKDSMAAMTRFLVWDEIYPKLNLTIKETYCRLCYQLDENGDKIPAVANPSESTPTDWKLYCKWYITLTTDSTPVEDYRLNTGYIIQDKPLSILFQSGPLTGREFEVTYWDETQTIPEHDVDDVDSQGHTPQAGEFRIIIKADGDILLPTLPADDGQGHIYANGGLCPQVGNVVTLVNVAIEDSFKEAARMELLRKGWAMAKLISSGKQAAWDEKRTVPDFLTGEGGDVPGLGDSIVGQEQSGYVVTGIETNLVSGEKQYSWGTFKPRGILSSSIDKIGSLSLSGGEATYAPLVSVSGSGDSQVIYVGNDYTDNGTSEGSSSSYTSQGASTAIRYAGGNTNIKTVYKSMGRNDAFASLVELVWDFLGTSGSRGTSERPTAGYSVTIEVTDNGGTVAGHAISSATDPDLIAALVAVRDQIGVRTTEAHNALTLQNGIITTPNEYDMYVRPLVFEGIDGGIDAWLYVGGEWQLILTSTTAIIDNLGYAIRLVVFGRIDGSIESAGMLTTQNAVTLFAKVEGGTSLAEKLAEAVFAMGILYHVEVEGIWKDVYYDNVWKYKEDNTKVPSDYLDDIVAYSFADMRADRIDFTAGAFTIGASHIDIGSSQTLDNFISQSAGMLTTSNFVELFAQAITPNGNDTLAEAFMAMGIKYHFSQAGGSYVDVYWSSDRNRWETDPEHPYTGSYPISPYSFAGIQADEIDFEGKTINIAASQTLTFIGGTEQGETQGTIDFKAAKVNFQTDELVFYKPDGTTEIALFDSSTGRLSLTGSNCTVSADFISMLAGGNTGLVISKKTMNGQALSKIEMGYFESDTLKAGLTFDVTQENNTNKYAISLTADSVDINAESLNWNGKIVGTTEVPRVIIEGDDGEGHTISKFQVDSEGNVTMNNLTANNGKFSGTLDAANYAYKVFFAAGNASIPSNSDFFVCTGTGNSDEVGLPDPSTVMGKVITIKNANKRNNDAGLKLHTYIPAVNLDDYSQPYSSALINIGFCKKIVVWSGPYSNTTNYKWHIIEREDYA